MNNRILSRLVAVLLLLPVYSASADTLIADLATIRGGNSPTLRLDQDGSSGFTPQVWDVAGNETNFFVRDNTHANKLPFRIQPDAPSHSLFIKANGNIGLNTDSPEAPLHVKRTSASPAEMFRFENTGGSWITWEKTSTNAKWYMTHEDAAGGRMILAHTFNDVGDGAEFALDTGGNLTIQGTLSTSSDVNAKQDISEIEGSLVLAKLEQMPVSEWSYKSDPQTRHVGPMAQDFRKAFDLGKSEKHISPADMAGVSLAAVKAQQQQIRQLETVQTRKDAEIAALKAEKDAEIAALQKRLAALEARLAD